MIVVGGGNAALCAAMAARHIVPRVLVLERAPEHMRGGNTRHTRNVRCAHPTSDKYCSGAYPEEEFFDDLVAVTGGPANPDLARFVIRQSSKLYEWMSEHGASWQPPLAGTLHLGRTNRWFLGGGKALLNAYYRTAQRMGISVRYDAVVEDLVIENGRFEGVALKGQGAGIGARADGGRGDRRLRGEPRMAGAELGRGGEEFRRARHSVQRRDDAGGAAGARARRRSAIRRDFTPSRSMRARRNTMAEL